MTLQDYGVVEKKGKKTLVPKLSKNKVKCLDKKIKGIARVFHCEEKVVKRLQICYKITVPQF